MKIGVLGKRYPVAGLFKDVLALCGVRRPHAVDVGGLNYPAFYKAFYQAKVTTTLNLRLKALRSDGNQIVASFHNAYDKSSVERRVDQVGGEVAELVLLDGRDDRAEGGLRRVLREDAGPDRDAVGPELLRALRVARCRRRLPGDDLAIGVGSDVAALADARRSLLEAQQVADAGASPDASCIVGELVLVE